MTCPSWFPEIEMEGRKAFANGVLAKDCPYTFINSPYWAQKDYEGFAREYRPKLDSWMNGWIAAKHQRLTA